MLCFDSKCDRFFNEPHIWLNIYDYTKDLLVSTVKYGANAGAKDLDFATSLTDGYGFQFKYKMS